MIIRFISNDFSIKKSFIIRDTRAKAILQLVEDLYLSDKELDNLQNIRITGPEHEVNLLNKKVETLEATIEKLNAQLNSLQTL